MHSPVNYPSSLDTPSSYTVPAFLSSWFTSRRSSTPVQTAVATPSPSGIASTKESSIVSAELPAGDTGEVQQRSATLAKILQFLAHVLPGKEFRQPASLEEFQAIKKALHGGETRSNYSSLCLNHFNNHIVIMMPSLAHEIAAGLL
ncbi:unnamed protein product [Cyclocybe aegerita]|uniref:Uncharacterized protein n=1 Tax=Cyclocybe aegerita TaxID=1973307 RepID=A0A8S0W4D0_CYCAE|nr:unnamed protein product [Cyclocybe aegerita]